MLTFRSVAALLFIHTIVSTGLSETHRFEPKVFYNTFSGAHPPALRIKPGDSVHTYTIDAGGKDAAGAQRGRGPNPETGPFYIEGAEPGDTLVVRLLRLCRLGGLCSLVRLRHLVHLGAQCIQLAVGRSQLRRYLLIICT